MIDILCLCSPPLSTPISAPCSVRSMEMCKMCAELRHAHTAAKQEMSHITQLLHHNSMSAFDVCSTAMIQHPLEHLGLLKGPTTAAWQCRGLNPQPSVNNW